MKKQSRIANIISSKYYPLLLFLVSFVFVTFFSRSTSFLYVFEGGDPAIFKQMGLALLRGKTLYVDYFDNKGCILYFIQAVGLWLGGDFFILLMQAFSLTITLLIWDKMLALYHNEKVRFICLGVALFLLLCFYDDGDLSEEWCLPFASYPLLVYFRFIKLNKDIKPVDWLIIGLCFGIIAFIRVNNSVPFLGSVAYLFFVFLIKKDFRKFFINLACFIAGLSIIAGLCTLYFYIKASWHGVDEMVYASFISNFDYLAVKGWRQFYFYIFYFTFLSLCILQQINNSRNNKEILIPTFISYALFIVTFGIRRCFTHYLMAMLPLVVVLLMTINNNEKKSRTAFIAALLVAALFYLPIPLALAVNDLVIKNDKYSVIYNDFHHCIEDIPKEERDSIYNYNLYGNGAGLMQHEKLIQCNRVFFSSFAFNYKKLKEEETKKTFYPPKWIMVSWERFFDKGDARFILENYDLHCDFCHDRIYLKKPKIGKSFQVYLYRRKDQIPALEGQKP